MRDWSFMGFAAGCAALACWLLFVRSGIFPGAYGLWLCVSVPITAVLAASYAIRIAPYGAWRGGYWRAASVICLLFPAMAGAIAPAPQFLALALAFLAMSRDTPWMVIAIPIDLVIFWSEAYVVVFIVAAPVCVVGVAAFHGLLRLLAACRFRQGAAAKQG
jgi:hypothetical protein